MAKHNPTPAEMVALGIGDAPTLNPHSGMSEPTNQKLEQLRDAAHGVDFTKGLPKGKCPFLAMQLGVTIQDDDHSLKVGSRGPLLMEDIHFREKINHFDHERIPERVVHARGSGCHGHFELYSSIGHLSKAAIFNEVGVKTPMFVRFSTVLGSRGSMDTARDVRGFAMKFYTKEGNWDLVANNIPVFFINDAIKFPDIVHAGKPEPQTEIPQAQTAHDNLWDFVSWTPETTHMMMWAMSDRAIPRSYRMMQGFGVNTFTLVNKDDKRVFVKFHVRPLLGVHGLAWDECMKLGGADPDFHRRDLYEAIGTGNFPEYELGIQVVPEEDEHKFDFDILDDTKIIPEELVPVQYIGKITLDRLPSDFFAEVEQVAFCTQNVVPGIDFSDDPMLQGRNFSYLDTQLSRLGSVNFNQLPINRPIVSGLNNQRDGHMQMNVHTDKLNYFPNRLSMQGQAARPTNGGETQGSASHDDLRRNALATYRAKIAGMKERTKDPKFLEFFNQASLFYNSMTQVEKDHMIAAFSFELSRCDDQGIRERIRDRFNEVDHDLAMKIAANIGVAPPGEPKRKNPGLKSNFLSMVDSPYSPMDSIATRKIACIIGDGYNGADLKLIKDALEKEGALLMVIGTHKGTILSGDGSGKAPAPDAQKENVKDGVKAGFTTFNSKSVLFDGLVLIGGAHVKMLQEDGSVDAWIAETLKHCKAVAACGDSIPLIEYPCKLAGIKIAAKDGEVVNDQAVITSGAANAAWASAFVEALKKHRFWARNVKPIPA